MLLHLPVDYESLIEFQRLFAELKRQPRKAEVTDVTVKAGATFIWMQLFKALAYLARHNNRPGYLTADGVVPFENAVDALFGDGVEPIGVLVTAKVLEKIGDEYFCAIFAKENKHLSGNFKSGPEKGNLHSIVARQQKTLAKEAQAQGMLLGAADPEIFKKLDDTTMSDTEVQRCMMLIRNLDNCLGKSARKQHEFSKGMINDAFGVVERKTNEQLLKVYQWLVTNRDNPAVAKTTEQILADFKKVEVQMQPEDLL